MSAAATLTRRGAAPGRVRAFLGLVAIRALGLRAAVRLHRRADRDGQCATATCTGGSCCWSRSRWSAPARSRWRPTGSSTGTSTRATRERKAANSSPAPSVVRTAWTGAVVALVVFLGAAAALNPLCLVLAPARRGRAGRLPVREAVHLGAARHARPGPDDRPDRRLDGGHRPLVVDRRCVLGLAVGCWIGGFDLIYACQDYRIDREIGVQSLPARFGPQVALAFSRVAHYATVLLLLWFGALAHLGWTWTVGVASQRARSPTSTWLVKPTDLSKVNRAFFTANGFVGIGLLLFARDRSGLARLPGMTRGAPGAVGRRRHRRERNRLRRSGYSRAARRRPTRSTWSCRGQPG